MCIENQAVLLESVCFVFCVKNCGNSGNGQRVIGNLGLCLVVPAKIISHKADDFCSIFFLFILWFVDWARPEVLPEVAESN
jgi:hypothetical protein